MSDTAFHRDRIIIFGGSPKTIDLLMLAVIRSDDVLLVGAHLEADVHRYAQRFAVEHKTTFEDADIPTAASILVAHDNIAAATRLAQQARAAGTPIYVADQPLLSDFNILEFIERRQSTLRRMPS